MLDALFLNTLAVDLEQLEAEAQHSFLAVFEQVFSELLAHFSAAEREPMEAIETIAERRKVYFIE
jgi:hypothetical protein